LGFAFGGADQYLGSLVTLGPWTYAVSAMSAPWLLLPFVAGATQRQPRHAVLLGLVVTVSALAGYFVLTVSPLESVPLSRFPTALVALLPSNLLNILGGLVTGPLFGLLGHRWRATRSLSAAAWVAAAFCLEPLVRSAVGRLAWPSIVWVIEIAVGFGLAACFVWARTIHRPRLATGVDSPR
jgi:hypothetical protein